MSYPFNWWYLTEKHIMNKLQEYASLIETSNCYFIPKAANYVQNLLIKYGIYPGCKSKNRILIIDVICDTGHTLKAHKEMLKIAHKDAEIVTMSIIHKFGECDIKLFEIPQMLYDKWFFGFGMDLIHIDGKDYLREWPAIGWCDKVVSALHPLLEFHPIYMILKSLGKDKLLDQCRIDDYYDFSKLTVLTRTYQDER